MHSFIASLLARRYPNGPLLIPMHKHFYTLPNRHVDLFHVLARLATGRRIGCRFACLRAHRYSSFENCKVCAPHASFQLDTFWRAAPFCTHLDTVVYTHFSDCLPIFIRRLIGGVSTIAVFFGLQLIAVVRSQHDRRLLRGAGRSRRQETREAAAAATRHREHPTT